MTPQEQWGHFWDYCFPIWAPLTVGILIFLLCRLTFRKRIYPALLLLAALFGGFLLYFLLSLR